jgi:shikimate dehydrogenase
VTTARAACVVGWPVEHSRSPLIHNYWLSRYGIDGEYRREAVRKQDFAAFIAALAARGYVGANVTVPHKEAALALSQPDERAHAVGAVNTLWLEGDALRSTNTDVEGFLDNLDACAPHWDRDTGKALVLGAGGAARAVIFGLLSRGVERVAVANRTTSRAEALRASFGRRLHIADWARLEAELGDAALVVNTTTLGMHGQPALALDLARLRSHAVVADIVYVPVVTPLLAAAKARGLITADGLGMLLHQAVRGFVLWFGKTPEVTGALRTLVEADLAGSKPSAPVTGSNPSPPDGTAPSK